MENNSRLRIAIIIGSTRKGRFGPTVAKWFAEFAAAHAEVTVDLVDLAEFRLPEVLSDQPTAEAAALSARIAAADAFVVVTPEYNHSFPAALKNAIDWLFNEWKVKPVAFVSYGGLSGGLRAVEQLRQVFAELHAITVRNSVSFHGVWNQFDESGQPRDPRSAERSAKSMLEQLAWWAQSLRAARAAVPYPG